MADLDALYTSERLKADNAALQTRMLGKTLAETVRLEASVPPKPNPDMNAGDAAFTASTNQRSNAEIDAILAQQTPSTAPADSKVPFGLNHESTVTAGEATGAGLEGAEAVLADPRNAWLGVGPLGMAKLAKGAQGATDGLTRARYQVEGIIERAMNPAPLAERVIDTLNSKTAILPDAEAQQRALDLVRSGGVNRDTLTNYAPGTAHLSAPHALAAQEVITAESRTVIDTAQHALSTNDPAMAEQALAQLARLLDPAAAVSGATTATAQTMRMVSGEDLKALNLIMERTSKLTQGMAPLDQLRHILADPATDPAKQGKSLTQSFRNLISQAHEVVAHGDDAGAQVLLHEVQSTLVEEAQLSMFVTPKEVTAAQKIIKSVTAQHIVEANAAAIAKADKDSFKLTPTGPLQPKTPQTDYLKEDAANKLATVKEHQAQDLRVAKGTSVFSPKREPFKLTAPPGGAKTPRKPKQLDLLTLIAKEPKPEQLALEMAASVEHPELSKQFLSLIRKAQDAITFGKTEEVGKILAKLQASLTPPVKPNTTSQPSRLVPKEKEALKAFLAGAKAKGMTDLEALKAMVLDPSLQPDALVTAINNGKHPAWRDAFQHLLINSMLTPASDFINFAATFTMLPMHLAARTIGARVGQVSRLLGGRAGVMIGEDEAMLHGLFASFWDSVKLATRVARSAKAEIGPYAVREQGLADNPVTAEAMFHYSPTARAAAGVPQAEVYNSASFPMLSRAGAVSAAINFFGVATGLPGRLMLTGDQFIQSLAMNAEMHARVYRAASEQAVREGLSTADFYKAYRPLWRGMQQNMPADLRKAGEEFSLELSLNKELGKIGQAVLNTREQVNNLTGILGTVALPFFKTLANSSKATWEFSPLAPASNALGLVAKTIRSDMFGDDPVKRDLAVGKWAFGSMLMSSLVIASLNGRLTGRGPDSKELRQQGWDAAGLPDSFVYNTDTGARVQINRLGVVGNLAGMAADVADVWLTASDHDRGELAQLLTTAVVGNLSFDFLQNSAGVIQSLANGVKRKEDLDLLMKSLTSFVPLSGTMRSAERALTPNDTPLLIKDAHTTLDKLLARFPGYDTLAKQYGLDPVPVLRNQFGIAVKQPTAAYGTEWFNPLYISAPSQDGLLQQLSQLQLDLGMKVQPPSNIIGKGKVPLTNVEYDRLQRLSGDLWRTRAEALLPTLQRKDIPDQVKRDLISSHLMHAHQTAAALLKGDDPDLVRDLTSRKVDQYTQPHAPRRATRTPLTLE